MMGTYLRHLRGGARRGFRHRLPLSRSGRDLLLFLSVVAAVAGCGSTSSTAGSDGVSSSAQASSSSSSSSTSGNTSSGGGAANPCTLVTKDQVSSAVGLPVVDGKFDNQTGKPTCSWIAVDPNNATIAVISVDPSPASFDAAKQQNGQNGIMIRPVSNLGQDAFYFGSGEGSLLEVKTASGVLYVSATLRPSSAGEDQAELVLAQAAVARL